MQNVIDVNFKKTQTPQTSNEVEYPKYFLFKLIEGGRSFTRIEIQKVLDGVNYDKARKINYSENGQIALHEVMEAYRNRTKTKSVKLTLV